MKKTITAAVLICAAACGLGAWITTSNADDLAPTKPQVSALGEVPQPSAARPDPTCGVAPIALTFDDGPNTGTEATLDILRERRVQATFFFQGNHVEGRAMTVRRTVREGHEVGNHTYTHPQLTKLSDTDVRYQLGRTQQVIGQVSGTVPRFVRAPLGLFSPSVLSTSDRFGLTPIRWNVQGEDWLDTTTADELTAKIVERARVGGTILLHEQHDQTRQALPRIIDILRGKGFCFDGLSAGGIDKPFSRGQA